jgi:5'-deoxynucleotidase YfbR-like HD superfamily hydrolase
MTIDDVAADREQAEAERKLIREVFALRASGKVKRWHTVSVIGEQTVDQHCAQCVSLLLLLHPDPSIDLIKAVLWHDSSEQRTGDMPAPIKRSHPDLRAAYHAAEMDVCQAQVSDAFARLSDEDKRWVRTVDILEMALWAADQYMLGNQHALVWLGRAEKYLTLDGHMPIPVGRMLVIIRHQVSVGSWNLENV